MPHYTMHVLNAFLLTVVLIIALERVAARFGLLDLPHGRKRHEGSVPLTGGLAMFIAFLFPVVSLEAPLDVDVGLLAGLLALVIIGVADDRLEIGPLTKLAGQIVAVAAMVLPGHHLIGLDTLLGLPIEHGVAVKVVLTILFVVGMINAFNMIDGIDGLAGGAAAVALLGFVGIAWMSGHLATCVQVLLLLFAVLGFLVFNMRHPWRRRAAVFMGDAGSMMLGAAVAFFAIDLATGPAPAAPLPVLLWLFALPAFDTVLLIARRLWAGHSPLVGDRRHLHHVMLQLGLSASAATTVLIGCSLLLAGFGLVGWAAGLPADVISAGLLIPFGAHAAFVVLGAPLFARTSVTDEVGLVSAVGSARGVGD
jgi:UDP-GlcNAc:undecaprenyl-phosphate GlcNAc-1-phosphate transferase